METKLTQKIDEKESKKLQFETLRTVMVDHIYIRLLQEKKSKETFVDVRKRSLNEQFSKKGICIPTKKWKKVFEMVSGMMSE